MFTWRPFDAYFRLITGRRNPSLILMTVFTLLGMPEWAFLSVVIWTVLSTLILFVRLFQGLAVRQFSGQPLASWMEDPEAAASLIQQRSEPFPRPGVPTEMAEALTLPSTSMLRTRNYGDDPQVRSLCERGARALR